jgi:hypothetical protein
MRITNDQFIEIKRDDLSGNIDIDIAVSTTEDNASKAQELSFMLQTTAQGMDPALHNIILGEIARLQKMPDLAKKIETYQPQPDPMQQQMQQLQLQMLQAQVANEQAKGQDRQIDAQLKSAKAATEQAKARSMHSSADMTDLNFLEKESGADKQHEMDMQQNQLDANHTSAMDQAAIQQQTEMQKADINHRSQMDQAAMNNIHREHMGVKDRELKQSLAKNGIKGS